MAVAEVGAENLVIVSDCSNLYNAFKNNNLFAT